MILQPTQVVQTYPVVGYMKILEINHSALINAMEDMKHYGNVEINRQFTMKI